MTRRWLLGLSTMLVGTLATAAYAQFDLPRNVHLPSTVLVTSPLRGLAPECHILNASNRAFSVEIALVTANGQELNKRERFVFPGQAEQVGLQAQDNIVHIAYCRFEIPFDPGFKANHARAVLQTYFYNTDDNSSNASHTSEAR
jgi:hypothetical protein